MFFQLYFHSQYILKSTFWFSIIYWIIFNYQTWICLTNPLACSKTNSSSLTWWHLLLSLYFSLIEKNYYPHSDSYLNCGGHNLALPHTHYIHHQIKWILLLKHLSHWISFPLFNYQYYQPCSILYYGVSLSRKALLAFTE